MIPPRLTALAQFIGQDEVVADIGSDHGFLPLLLVKSGHSYVYASENKEGPYRRLKEETKEALDAIEVALADGTQNLPSNITTVVIAGMGGSLIKRILLKHRANLAKVKKIILAPHGNEEEVRLTLKDLKFQIINEKIVKESRHYYEIIVAKPAREVSLSAGDAIFGPINLANKSPEFLAKWQEIYQRNAKLLANPQLDKETLESLNEKQTLISGVLKE